MNRTIAPARLRLSCAAFAAAACTSFAVAPARAQDAAAGGMAFQECADCHSPSASNGAGPGLLGVVGRRAGTLPGFAYSAAMTKSGITWDAAALDKFLAAPKKALPGTSMDFPGVDDAKERADLIAYLQSLK
jgi:cytochrome c